MCVWGGGGGGGVRVFMLFSFVLSINDFDCCDYVRPSARYGD